jgi:hypothetical protein
MNKCQKCFVLNCYFVDLSKESINDQPIRGGMMVG